MFVFIVLLIPSNNTLKCLLRLKKAKQAASRKLHRGKLKILAVEKDWLAVDPVSLMSDQL